MARLKIGYVGAGYMAQKVHLPNIQGLPELELAALAEVRPELGKMTAERFRIPKLYRNHLELAADKDIEAVAVSGHFAGQGEIAREVLLAGKDVFMEKPMAVSVEQAQRILDAEVKSGKRVMVGYMKRYDGGNLLVKEYIDGWKKSGEMGKVTFARNHGFCGSWDAGLDTAFATTKEKVPDVAPAKPSWMPDKYYGGYIGYLQQYTHNINLLRWFLGSGDDLKIRTVDLDPEHGYSGVVIMSAGGVKCVLESGNVAYHAWDEHTQVFFEKGWVRTVAPPLLHRNTPASVEVCRTDKGTVKSEMFPASGWTWSYKEEMRHFAECVQSGAPFRSPASDAMVDVRTFEEIYRQHIANMGG
jgi:predicted dehydrogenase